jgi:hypothetical protein
MATCPLLPPATRFRQFVWEIRYAETRAAIRFDFPVRAGADFSDRQPKNRIATEPTAQSLILSQQ